MKDSRRPANKAHHPADDRSLHVQYAGLSTNRDVSRTKTYGKIICRRRDFLGEITISDRDGIRSLSFGEAGIQSRIRLDQPETLLMEYSRAMMTALVFRSDPRSVLLIGLGGGSLITFLLQACPSASIDAVEIREEIIGLAHDYFFIPRGNGQLTIINAAGQDFVKLQAERGHFYDLILVDAFDEGGPAAKLGEEEFLQACRDRLGEDGLLVSNVWTGPGEDFPGSYARVKRVFGGNALQLVLSESEGNAIIIAFRNPAMCRDLSRYRQEARRLHLQWGIDFPRFFRLLRQQNVHSRSS
jgi:spermidine synthase